MNQNITHILPMTQANLDHWLNSQTNATKDWVHQLDFSADEGQLCWLPPSLSTTQRSQMPTVLFGLGDKTENYWAFGGLAKQLPKGQYRIDADWENEYWDKVLLAWQLGTYQFSRYKRPEKTPYKPAVCLAPEQVDTSWIQKQAQTICWVRDLINTPADDLGPSELSEAVQTFAQTLGGRFSEIVGDDLLEAGYPAVHAVGRACDDAPRVLQVDWGKEEDPLIVLAGKGVCFDTGGLDLKTPSGMLTMKKDMGGAAHALGVARLVMEAKLPVRVKLLIGAVENSIGGNALHPSDIIATRKGVSVEVGNTDAEGRLVLADLLHEGSQYKPDYIIDFATLTGAARIALGPDLPAMFTNKEDIASSLLKVSDRLGDPMWRLPLYAPYEKFLKSDLADTNNVSKTGYGGAITAALFLQKFVPEGLSWVHFDLMAANTRDLPGRPKGGEAMGIRAVYQWLAERYPSK